jgi:arylsulfatase A-like enzyme
MTRPTRYQSHHFHQRRLMTWMTLKMEDLKNGTRSWKKMTRDHYHSYLSQHSPRRQHRIRRRHPRSAPSHPDQHDRAPLRLHQHGHVEYEWPTPASSGIHGCSADTAELERFVPATADAVSDARGQAGEI